MNEALVSLIHYEYKIVNIEGQRERERERERELFVECSKPNRFKGTVLSIIT